MEEEKFTHIKHKDLLDYYWKYFELQSNQRNQIFAQYYTILTALSAGFITVYELEITWAKRFILVSVIFISFVFHSYRTECVK